MVKVERIEHPDLFTQGQRRRVVYLTLAIMGAVLVFGLLLAIHVTINGGSFWSIFARVSVAAPIFGAVTVAAQAALAGFIRSSTVQFNVTATADADTTATVPHTLGQVPDEVVYQWIDAAARISLWCETIASRDATNVVLTKATTAGSGAAGAQLRVIIRKPHSLVR